MAAAKSPPPRSVVAAIEQARARGWDATKIADRLNLDPALVRSVVDEQNRVAQETGTQ